MIWGTPILGTLMGMGQNPMKLQCDWGNDHPSTRWFRVGCQGIDSWPYELWVFIDVVEHQMYGNAPWTY